MRIKKIEKRFYRGKVYDLKISGDPSYNIENIKVHNSAAGCLVSYLLGIVQIDPLEYNLLFERFLNEGRVGKSLPDIDNDIAGSRREEVKRYIERRYGENYVASIGTYGTFKVRAALKDLVREMGGDSKEANYISVIIDPEDTFVDVINKCLDPKNNPRLYGFIKKHAYQVNQIPLIFQQPKTQSVHAAGVLIVPKENGAIYQQLPVKKMDGIVITEWEGTQIEESGFLKVDILGIRQLDKFNDMIALIKKNYGVDISFKDIPLDTPGVYRFFQQGFNEDVFQFGGAGLKSYCKLLLPDNIEDLIATVALYRPGPIEIGAHERYAQIKNGRRLPSYRYGLEEITKPTYSEIIYQEQIMKIVQHLGGFTLVEADDVRKAMGKKLPEVMVKYKQKFIDGAVQRGCPEEEAAQIWADMEVFAGYAFNRSHATCYGITGYYSQWFKYKYPLEFWLVSLTYSKDEEIQSKIAEIQHIAENISIKGPNILKSQGDYFGDIETQTIYWSLSSIKGIAGKVLTEIEQFKKSAYFVDFEDFVKELEIYKKNKKARLKEGERMLFPFNRRVVFRLIVAGAFDELERIKVPQERAKLLYKYYHMLYPSHKKVVEDSVGEYYEMFECKEDYRWTMEQRKICGFGFIDYPNLLKTLSFKGKTLFKSNKEVSEMDLLGRAQKVIVAGVVEEVKSKNSKNGPFAQIIIHDGYSELSITFWNEFFRLHSEEILNSKDKLLFFSGEALYDEGYQKTNVIHSKSYSELQILK